MAFRIFAPTSTMGRGALTSGQMSLNTGLRGRFPFGDLHEIRVKDECVVLIDTDLGRIAIKAPGEDEPVLDVRWTKTRNAGSIALGAAIRALGLDPKQCVGQHKTAFKDNLLIVDFNPDRK